LVGVKPDLYPWWGVAGSLAVLALSVFLAMTVLWMIGDHRTSSCDSPTRTVPAGFTAMVEGPSEPCGD
jgi:hypothetical protein